MLFEEYVKETKRTWKLYQEEKEELYHIHMGVVGEIGELIDAIKKNLAYKKPLDIVNMKEEIGDCFYYVARLADVCYRKSEIFFIKEQTFSFNKHWKMNNYAMTDLLTTGLYKWVLGFQDIVPFHEGNVNSIAKKMIVEMYYALAGVTYSLNLDLQEVYQTNINKLKARFPEGFSEDKAINRDLDKEREILEK